MMKEKDFLDDFSYDYEKNYEEEKSEAGDTFNRKNVDKIKRLIILMFVLVCALPILFCLYMMVRMNSIQNKVDALYEQISEGNVHLAKENSNIEVDDSEDLTLLDQDSYEDLEKSTTEEEQPLMMLGITDTVEGITAEEVSWDRIEDKAEATISNGKKVYLTFDDGPSSYTDEILDILAENNVRATFFVVMNPDETTWHSYKRIVEDGHTLAMHSYTHEYSTVYASLESFEQDVSDIHDFLYEQTGVDCNMYRFPGGSSNTVSNISKQDMLAYLYDKGIQYYDWNALSFDAEDGSLTKEQLNENIMGYVRSNEGDSIVLMHDLENIHTTAEALQDLIDTLKAEGYTLAPITSSTKPVQHVTYQGIDQ